MSPVLLSSSHQQLDVTPVDLLLNAPVLPYHKLPAYMYTSLDPLADSYCVSDVI